MTFSPCGVMVTSSVSCFVLIFATLTSDPSRVRPVSNRPLAARFAACSSSRCSDTTLRR